MSVKRNVLRVAATTVASGILATGALALASPAGASTVSGGYSFTTLDNAHDLTFNQLLGINDEGTMAGYFGSGMPGHPNKGYVLLPPYGPHGYVNEDFPGSAQTQVTGLNNRGVTVGFWADAKGDNFGWVNAGGTFRQVDYPAASPASPSVDQLLGVNDRGIAVGFYTDAQGTSHGYEYNINTGTYSVVTDPKDPGASLTAAAISDSGDVAGFYTASDGTTDGFLLRYAHSRHCPFIALAFPGASATSALGVNGSDEAVGTYTDGSGNSATTHGFTWTPQGGFTTVDDPHGVGTTTINGVNDRGDLVGFYADANGNTDGFLALP